MIVFFEISNNDKLVYEIKNKRCRKFLYNSDDFLFSDKIFSYLLKEDKFKFYRKKVYLSNENINNINLNQIIDIEIKKISQDISGEVLYYFINNFSQTDEKIFFELVVVFIDQFLLEDIKSDCLKCVMNLNNFVYFYPQSLFTIFELSKIKLNFSLLYLFEEEVKLINVKDGFIDDVFYLNFGLNSLKKMFFEKGTQSLYVKFFKGEKLNIIEENIIKNIMEEYVKIISIWLEDNNISQYCFVDNDKMIRYFDNFIKKGMFFLLKDIEKGSCSCKNIDIQNYLKYFDKLKFTYLKL